MPHNFDRGLGVWEASLPKAREWDVWLAHHLHAISAEPWGEFLLDMAMAQQQCFVLMSRRLRANPTWDPSVGEQEWYPVEQEAVAAYEKFKRERPTTLSLLSTEAPRWAIDLAEFQEGAFRMIVRLARELDAVRKHHGLIPVNVNPHAKPDEFDGVEQVN